MRLFAAIAPPQGVRALMSRACQTLAPLSDQTVWCKPEQLHITLAFIGESPPAFQPHLWQALDRACAVVPAMDCRAAGFGFFGSRRSPTFLWAGVEPAEDLEMLHDRLWKALEALGYKRQERRFHAHVTLARCKGRARNKAVLEVMERMEDDVFGEWCAEGVTLFESKPSPRGQIYRALHTSPFAKFAK